MQTLSHLIKRIEVEPGENRHETLIHVQPRRDALIAFAIEHPGPKKACGHAASG